MSVFSKLSVVILFVIAFFSGNLKSITAAANQAGSGKAVLEPRDGGGTGH